MKEKDRDQTKQSDALLWLAGAVVVGIGVTWLGISQPWSSGEEEPPPAAAVQLAPARGPVAAPAARPQPDASALRGTQTGLESTLDSNPLRMAQLAYEAGMLVEPEEYSAWGLYRRVLEQEPENAEAKQGLEKIAEELLRRANVAVDQGRFDDARATVVRIRTAIPVHPGADDLEFRIGKLAPAPEPVQARAEPEPAPAAAAADPEPVAAAEPQRAVPPPEPEVDPVLEPHEAFAAALAANRLLTPVDASAKHYVGVLSTIDADHELTLSARTQLFEVFLARAADAIISMDTDAAMTWIDEAELLGVDPAAVEGARGTLRNQLIEIESARRVPASTLTVLSYKAPIYPPRALERELDGWVDLEFVVARDGSTRDISVADASHNSYFRDEAVEAVAQWRFEPRVFMDEPIEQRAYTRIRFTLQ